jgi:soluble lytic murein transglycosylase-like protein
MPAQQIDRLVSANASAWGVDPALVKAIIANESAFNPAATSKTGAQGLMQLEPGTAAGLGVSNAYDPAQNIWGGTRYIKGLLDRFHGDLRLAVAAYNAGPGAVEKYGGVPPYAETQAYVENVLDSYQKYKTQ